MKNLRMKEYTFHFATIILFFFLVYIDQHIDLIDSPTQCSPYYRAETIPLVSIISHSLYFSHSIIYKVIFLSGLIALGFSFIQYYTDTKHQMIRDSIDVKAMHLDVLGSIPFEKVKLRHHVHNIKKNDLISRAREIDSFLITRHTMGTLFSYAYQGIFHTIVKKACRGESTTFLITSPNHCEGKSTTSANSAIQMANMGYKILLVDGNIRTPVLDLVILGTRPSKGLCDVLWHSETGKNCIRETTVKNLSFLPSGKIDSHDCRPDPCQTLQRFLDEIKNLYDVIIFDSPPILSFPDAGLMASVLDHVILIAQSRKTSKAAIMSAQKMVQSKNVHLLGVLLTCVHNRDLYDYSQFYNA